MLPSVFTSVFLRFDAPGFSLDWGRGSFAYLRTVIVFDRLIYWFVTFREL